MEYKIKVDSEIMISIITPTYNRSNLLPRLYNALLRQTSKSFEWIIIDDGSTDNTKYLVEKWIEENKLKITYTYQKNRGKYIAHNSGVKKASGDLCFCIDSDDFPTDTCIEDILKVWKKNNNEYAGIIALKSYTNERIIGTELPSNIQATSLYELTEKYKCHGDKTLVYKTDILKKNLFPEFEDVKFVTEAVVYDKIDVNNKMLLLNKILCICEYQEDGYSHNYMKLILNNPIGFNIYYMQRIDMALTPYQRIIYSSKYHVFKWMSGKNSYTYNGNHKILVSASIPLAFIFYVYYRLKKGN